MSQGSPEAKKRARLKWNAKNPYNAWVDRIHYRARQMGLEFNLTKADLTIPEYCPVLNIKLKQLGESRKQNADTPSVDRFNNDLGYTKDNCRIISFRANELKKDATPMELMKIVKYMLPLIDITVSNLRVVM